MCQLVNDKKKLMMASASMFACASTAFLIMAVSSDRWVTCMERMKTSPDSPRPMNFTEDSFFVTHFGLWRSCKDVADKNGELLDLDLPCVDIKYFADDANADGTQSDTVVDHILENVQLSALFPTLSLLTHAAGDAMCILAYFSKKRMLLTFCTGIAFVLSGLSLLVGIVLYLGAVTGEAGNTEPADADEVPDFSYEYGSSFGMLIVSFIFVEIAGVISVYFFIMQHRKRASDRRGTLHLKRTTTELLVDFLHKRPSGSKQLSSQGNSRQPSVYSMAIGNESPLPLQRDVTKQTMLSAAGSRYSLKSNGDRSHTSEGNHSDKYTTTVV